MKTKLKIYILLMIGTVAPIAVNAQWSNSPTTNLPICITSKKQTLSSIASDNSGGAFIAWADNALVDGNIYIQHVNSAGVIQWATNGIALTNNDRDDTQPIIIADEQGGAIITWYDFNTYEIFIQRIDASGTALWADNGLLISNPLHAINGVPDIQADGTGGAIITWQGSTPSVYYILAQKINASGVTQWTPGGVVLSSDTVAKEVPKIVTDGNGGAIVTWYDFRSAVDEDIYAQRVNSSGLVQWTVNGLAICTLAEYQSFPIIVSDGVGGAIIAWADNRDPTDKWAIYAQRINGSGTIQWPAEGTLICTNADYTQYYPGIVSDGSEGAILTWVDQRLNSVNSDIYAQRINNSGILSWTTDGVPVCTTTTSQYQVKIVKDNSGGAIITWLNGDIYSGTISAQKINSSGVAQWTTNGVFVTTATNGKNKPVLAYDGSGGTIISWIDKRNASNFDVYAQNVCSDGKLGGATTSTCETTTEITSSDPLESEETFTIYPNPSQGIMIIATKIEGDYSIIDARGKVIRQFQIGNPSDQIVIEGLNNGIYFIRTQNNNLSISKKIIVQK